MGLFDLFTDKKKVIGFSLENVHAEHQKNPRHFLIPSQEEINQLNAHLAVHTHDFHSKRGLFQKIGLRKRFLAYLKKSNLEAYTALIEKLNLRG